MGKRAVYGWSVVSGFPVPQLHPQTCPAGKKRERGHDIPVPLNPSRTVPGLSASSLAVFSFAPILQRNAKSHAAMHYTYSIEIADGNLVCIRRKVGEIRRPHHARFKTRTARMIEPRSFMLILAIQIYSWSLVCLCSEKLQDPRLTVREYRLRVRAFAHKIQSSHKKATQVHLQGGNSTGKSELMLQK